jgi:hypothetical protein
MVAVAVAQVCQPSPHSNLDRVPVYGPKVQISSGGSAVNPSCTKRTAESCAHPEHGGRLVAASGQLVDVLSSGRVGSSVVLDSPDEICVQLWASTPACETEVSIVGRAMATEEYSAEPNSATNVIPREISADAGNNSEVWLKIGPIKACSEHLDRCGVRVTVNINRNTFSFPHLEGVKWIKITPNIELATYSVPLSDNYTVSATMKALCNGRELNFISQEQKIVSQQKLPFNTEYRVFQLEGTGTHGGVVDAEVGIHLLNKL